MKRTTIFLDEPLHRRLQQVGRSEGRSFAAVVRDAMTAYLERRETSEPGRLPSIAGMFASGAQDTSERMRDFGPPELHA